MKQPFLLRRAAVAAGLLMLLAAPRSVVYREVINVGGHCFDTGTVC